MSFLTWNVAPIVSLMWKVHVARGERVGLQGAIGMDRHVLGDEAVERQHVVDDRRLLGHLAVGKQKRGQVSIRRRDQSAARAGSGAGWLEGRSGIGRLGQRRGSETVEARDILNGD